MFRHLAMWKFNDETSAGKLREDAIKIKAGLEELAYEVHGVLSIDVCIDPVRDAEDDEGDGCGADITADCLFDHREAYRAYLEHPRHKAVEKLIDACTEKCLFMDFEEEDGEEDLI
jgi:hypothetical protein